MKLDDSDRLEERRIANDFASSRNSDKATLFAEGVYIAAWLFVMLAIVYTWLNGGS